MHYTEMTVRLLEYLAAAEGKHSEDRLTTAADLAAAIAPNDERVSPRLVSFGVEELIGARLMSGYPIGAEEMTRDDSAYLGLDVTGSGLRFLEALRAQAKREGKIFPWLWSVVEKAATLGNLITMAAALAGK